MNHGKSSNTRNLNFGDAHSDYLTVTSSVQILQNWPDEFLNFLSEVEYLCWYTQDPYYLRTRYYEIIHRSPRFMQNASTLWMKNLGMPLNQLLYLKKYDRSCDSFWRYAPEFVKHINISKIPFCLPDKYWNRLKHLFGPPNKLKYVHPFKNAVRKWRMFCSTVIYTQVAGRFWSWPPWVTDNILIISDVNHMRDQLTDRRWKEIKFVLSKIASQIRDPDSVPLCLPSEYWKPIERLFPLPSIEKVFSAHLEWAKKRLRENNRIFCSVCLYRLAGYRWSQIPATRMGIFEMSYFSKKVGNLIEKGCFEKFIEILFSVMKELQKDN